MSVSNRLVAHLRSLERDVDDEEALPQQGKRKRKKSRSLS